MFYIKILLVCIVIFAVLELLGMVIVPEREEKDSIALYFVKGLFLAFAVFEILAVPCIFTSQSFGFLTVLYGGILLLLCLLSLVLNRGRIGEWIRSEMNVVKMFFHRENSNRNWRELGIPVVMLAAVGLILFEMFMYVHYAHIDDDDAFYVATAVTTVEEDSMFQVNAYTGDPYSSFPARYVLSPFPIWNSFLSKVFAVHPTIFAHNFLPVLLIAAAFFVYYLIGMELFEQDRRKTGYFLVFCTVIQMYSGYTRHPQGMVYLVRLWQGKAVLAAVLLPACLYAAMRLFWKEAGWRDWLFCLTLMLSCCMVSSMGIMLGAIGMGLLGILYAVMHKSLRNLVYTALCCVPNILLAGLYLVIK